MLIDSWLQNTPRIKKELGATYDGAYVCENLNRDRLCQTNSCEKISSGDTWVEHVNRAAELKEKLCPKYPRSLAHLVNDRVDIAYFTGPLLGLITKALTQP